LNLPKGSRDGTVDEVELDILLSGDQKFSVKNVCLQTAEIFMNAEFFQQ
jgi:hypothetical protein